MKIHTADFGVTGVVAAGGHSRRFGGGPPKALVRIGRKTLVEFCLDELFAAGISRCIVYSDRREWDWRLKPILARYANAYLLHDTGVASTVSLAQDAANRVRSGSLCFIYGHAPRPAEHIRKLLQAQRQAITMTLVSSSSRRDLIHCDSEFLEPPLICDAEAIAADDSRSWGEYIERHRGTMNVIRVNGPQEANYRSELLAYSRYVQSFCIRDAGDEGSLADMKFHELPLGERIARGWLCPLPQMDFTLG
jgi:hypothetical protein